MLLTASTWAVPPSTRVNELRASEVKALRSASTARTTSVADWALVSSGKMASCPLMSNPPPEIVANCWVACRLGPLTVT